MERGVSVWWTVAGLRLSAYNPSSVCALHGGAWQDDYHRTARKATQREEIRAPLRLRAVRARVHHDQPRQEVLQRRLSHESLPGPRDGVAARERRDRRRAPRELTLRGPRRRPAALPAPGGAGARVYPCASAAVNAGGITGPREQSTLAVAASIVSNTGTMLGRPTIASTAAPGPPDGPAGQLTALGALGRPRDAPGTPRSSSR